MQSVSWAFALVLPKAGNNIAAKMAMMAITTNSSINVNAHLRVTMNAPFGSTMNSTRDARFQWEFL